MIARRKNIQLQAFVSGSIGFIANNVRLAVSHVCLGVDDMQLLGNKALVVRAEIYSENLRNLYADLASIGITLSNESLPDEAELQEGTEYPLSIQITSFSEGSDRKIQIPKIPG
jgi:hypothetical protein